MLTVQICHYGTKIFTNSSQQQTAQVRNPSDRYSCQKDIAKHIFVQQNVFCKDFGGYIFVVHFFQ